MATLTTFYLSRIANCRVLSRDGRSIGKLVDLVVDTSEQYAIKPKVVGAKLKIGSDIIVVNYNNISITKIKNKYRIVCTALEQTTFDPDTTLSLVKFVLDKQIVDIEGKKLVRVNDLRLATVNSGTYLLAVDIGVEGLLRRLGFAKPFKRMLTPFNKSLPAKFILWEDVATINFTQVGITLGKTQSKLMTLHPSDLADIIEDMDRKSQVAVFRSLDEERAADVLEEMETDSQVYVLENMPTDKAADVLEKMPADEVADILDDLENDYAEELLNEMVHESSQEVRELMQYPEDQVGALMTTDYIAFSESMTVQETINELRKLKPPADQIYYLYVLDGEEHLVATVSLRDLITSEPNLKLLEIMQKKVVKVADNSKIDSLAEIISKYNLLAIPVVNKDNKMLGMVIIDDVVFTLLKSRKFRA